MKKYINYTMDFYKIGTFSSVPIYIHGLTMLFYSILILKAFIFMGLSTGITFLTILPSVLFFITAHEFGHIFAGRLFGIQAEKVLLFPIGGIALIKDIPKTHEEEFILAIGGPLVNMIFVIIIGSLSYLSVLIMGPNWFSNFLYTLTIINAVMALFNLIPAYPMDGGRVLKSIIWKYTNQEEATVKAAFIGQIFAVILFVLSIYFSQFVMLFISVFLYFQASKERTLYSNKKHYS